MQTIQKPETPKRPRKKALSARVESKLNPFINLRMQVLDLNNMVDLSVAAQLPTSSIYYSLANRAHITYINLRKIASALGFPIDLFGKIYFEECLTESELYLVSALCNITFADALKLQLSLANVNDTQNLCSFYCQPELTA